MKGIENVVVKGENIDKALRRVEELEQKGYSKKELYYSAGGKRVGNHVVLRSIGNGEYLIELVIFHSLKMVEVTVYAAEHLL